MPKSAINHLVFKTQNWQQQLAQAITDPAILLKQLNINPERFPNYQGASEDFRLKVPQSYAAKMRKGDHQDPLLLQVMANGIELHTQPTFSADPVGDTKTMPVPGLLHKYHGRVLLVTTGACAVHCRYCFRRHFPYNDNQPARQAWQPSLDYIARDNSISEVILSGGDPLVLNDSKLGELIHKIEQIPHVQRLRIHTRLPVVLPDRITDELMKTLLGRRLQLCLVIHSNHANEIGQAEAEKLTRLKTAGTTLLNQAVLLRGINDSAEAQIALCERLYEAGVLPYYLHLLDKVQGAAHFDSDMRRATQIMQQLNHTLPGYLVPRLVREIEGEKSKTAVFGL